MIIDDLDEVTLDVEENGEEVQRTLDRLVIERGSWATVLLHFQRRRKDGQWGAPKAMLIRFAKQNGRYRRHSAATLNAQAAQQTAAALLRWFGDSPQESDDDDE